MRSAVLATRADRTGVFSRNCSSLGTVGGGDAVVLVEEVEDAVAPFTFELERLAPADADSRGDCRLLPGRRRVRQRRRRVVDVDVDVSCEGNWYVRRRVVTETGVAKQTSEESNTMTCCKVQTFRLGDVDRK